MCHSHLITWDEIRLICIIDSILILKVKWRRRRVEIRRWSCHHDGDDIISFIYMAATSSYHRLLTWLWHCSSLISAAYNLLTTWWIMLSSVYACTGRGRCTSFVHLIIIIITKNDSYVFPRLFYTSVMLLHAVISPEDRDFIIIRPCW